MIPEKNKRHTTRKVQGFDYTMIADFS